MTPEERAELRAKAETATPGPWKHYGMAGVAGPDWEIIDERRVECEGCDEPVALIGCDTLASARFIAAADPPTVLALLDALEAAEGRLAKVRAIVDLADAAAARKPGRIWVVPDALRAALGADDA